MPDIPADVVAQYRPGAQQLTERIVERITHEVGGFTDPDNPIIAYGVREAITRAVNLFIEAVAGAPTTGAEVFTFYRWLGHYEAQAGHNLDAMRAAHQIATQESWEDVRRATADLGQPAEVVTALGDALLAFQNTLLRQAVCGYMETDQEDEREGHRARLLDALFSHDTDVDLGPLAQRAGWTVPSAVVVIVCRATRATLADLRTTRGILVRVRNGAASIVVDEAQAEQTACALSAGAPSPVAMSWSVRPHDTHHAHRWARQTLALAASGAATPDSAGIVRCRDVQALLCLHADPVLRRYSDNMALQPLLAETPARRRALAETMLLWLQTHASAPAIARRLGVHDQTVRQRLRRVRQLFGDRLDDPDQTVGLLIALESAMPRWRESP